MSIAEDLEENPTLQPMCEPISPRTSDILGLIQQYNVHQEHAAVNGPYYPQFYTPTLDQPSSHRELPPTPPDLSFVTASTNGKLLFLTCV